MNFKIWRKIKSMGDYTSVRFAIHELIPELAASWACNLVGGAQRAFYAAVLPCLSSSASLTPSQAG
jgi:hypothetical protein